jgi:2Fe-2S ferredoxin
MAKTVNGRSKRGSGIFMGSLKVTFIEPGGAVRQIEDAEDGMSVMEIAKQNGVEGVYADCGGACSCATCHVYVDADWMAKVGQPDEIEFSMLDMIADVQKDNSRLSCQIRMRAELDGLKVEVAPSIY